MKTILIKLIPVILCLLCVEPVLAQVNVVTSTVYGYRTESYPDDPLGGSSYLETAGDYSARLRTPNSRIIVFSPAGDCFLTAQGNQAWLWNASNGAEIAVMPHGAKIEFVSFSRDGSYVLISGGNNSKIWNTPSGSFRCMLPQNSTVRLAAISNDSCMVATSGNDGFYIWSATAGNNLLSMPNNSPSFMLFSPDSTKLVTISGGKAALYRIPEGAMVGTLTTDGPVGSAVFSSDSKYLVVGTAQMAHLWDAQGFIKLGDCQYGPGYR